MAKKSKKIKWFSIDVSLIKTLIEFEPAESQQALKALLKYTDIINRKGIENIDYIDDLETDEQFKTMYSGLSKTEQILFKLLKGPVDESFNHMKESIEAGKRGAEERKRKQQAAADQQTAGPIEKPDEINTTGPDFEEYINRQYRNHPQAGSV